MGAGLPGCALVPRDPATVPSHAWLEAMLAGHAPLPAILVLGEQHDAPEHQALQAQVIRRLARAGRLAAVVLEMAEQGAGTTAGLAPQADEAQIQQALGWNPQAWSWKVYAGPVMAAVQAGVPVLGGNLPRSRIRSTFADETIDQRLDAAALQRQREAVRAGHCDLLPAAQIGPMTRVQVARDIALAQTAWAQARPERVVVVICGAQHALRSLGLPRHVPPQARVHVVVASAAQAEQAMQPGDADTVITTRPRPPKDDCAPLRNRRIPAPPPPAIRTGFSAG